MKRPLPSQSAAIALGSLYENELATAQTALGRKDSEALHDLRVALRRLVVLVGHLAVTSKPRDRLLRDIKRVLKQSNQERDLQVMLNWLQAQWPRLSEAEHGGARLWQRKLIRLQQRRRFEPEQMAAALSRLPPLFHELSSPNKTAPHELGMLVAQHLEKNVGELVALLAQEEAAAQLHQIRLKTKAVRYLLLPFTPSLPECTRAESLLKEMQTALGEWHDAVLRERSLHRYLQREFVAIEAARGAHGAEDVWAERAPYLPGLLALLRLNHRAQARRAASIQHCYLHDGGAHLAILMKQVLAELRRAAKACQD